jgi:hypothetical protein
MRPSRGMGDVMPSKMGKAKTKARRDNTDFTEYAEGGKVKPGLYANIHAKQKRIKAGSGEKMRPVGSKGAPSKADFIKSAKTAKKK